ncbi:MAG: hypothetical protein FWE82_08610, partial [Defluviitaleaceae bacterium]|nr:hypothetical protein [Defluviitaleaceae bacterium]
ALTANAVSGQQEMFLSSGFDGFMSKPINTNDLKTILTNFVKNKREATELDENKSKSESSNLVSFTGSLEEAVAMDIESALETLENIMGKINERDDAESGLYTTTVHGIKSALAIINENEASAFAYMLEQAGESKNFDKIISDTPLLIEKLKLLLKKLLS